MKFLYPASNSASGLTPPQLALKIARHSPCASCSSCYGLHPPLGTEVVPDDQQAVQSTLVDQYGSDDEDDMQLPYLEYCGCGHFSSAHGANELELGSEEFARRGRVAIRLDELLQDVGKLTDFDYVDTDITSLRKQMQLPVSLLSPTMATFSISQKKSSSNPSSPASSVLSEVPPFKKRRISISSLSDDDDDEDDEEEERPLAARVKPSHRSGKKGPGYKSKPHPASKKHAKSNGSSKTNGHSAATVKVEEPMDEAQLNRLVTGVPVDTGQPSAGGLSSKPEKLVNVELRKGVIQVTAVKNDKQPRSMVILTGLKTLFQKQLPKMPREYIARLVYDSNSKALAIVKRGYKVVGGICFRPFPHRGFAEIVFFATASVDQVKGYGGMLMDHFKAHIKQTYPGMMHFLTYADNYAVGYFEKQGFSKDITLDRSVWAGYIKDYEGGTIMQCTMLPKVDYLNKVELIAQQTEAIMSKIREVSKSHIVYPGLPQFQNGNPGGTVVNPMDVPGLRESGWNPMMATSVRGIPKSMEHSQMERLLRDLKGHSNAWPFMQPVDGDEVPDYYEVIKQPMDFRTMEHKLDTNQYQSLAQFVDDAMLIFKNCQQYNPEETVYHKSAVRLEKYLKELLAGKMKRED
ncbi:histone acetyltransferase [Pleurotus pulmonarius]|nr:histone acetyltransferase [Pleurotus pulmonarius]KAF4598182.1 histone acetyltransferase [Pleurotus pulmonarius]KAF4599440.1 histone acetyltransferase [Pleurotus pulmonarius]